MYVLPIQLLCANADTKGMRDCTIVVIVNVCEQMIKNRTNGLFVLELFKHKLVVVRERTAYDKTRYIM